MKILLIFILLFTLNCSTNKVSKLHGFRLIENKYEKIEINKNNKNDVRKLIGPPSTISNFDINKWFYIEREKTNQSIVKLGVQKINKNNVLVLKFNNMGILEKKEILKLEDMNEVLLVKNVTKKKFRQDNFLYNIFSSLREKINAPTRNR
tara:strand:- start:1447 stop:1896 length:450 start_codon:yes stop_codon:yes gene_type:complete